MCVYCSAALLPVQHKGVVAPRAACARRTALQRQLVHNTRGLRVQGFLSAAMLNYLSLLGWSDGSEKEIYTMEELQEAFSIDRITKSAAVFDKAKLSWMNGQHLRALPSDEARLASLLRGLP